MSNQESTLVELNDETLKELLDQPNVWTPHYQLKRKLIGKDLGRFTGAESLARLNYNGKIISPCNFIENIERLGLIGKLNQILTKKDVDIAREIKEIYGIKFDVAINISPTQEGLTDYVNELLRMIKSAGLDNDMFCLELLESPCDEVRLQKTHEALKVAYENGVHIAIDDILTGANLFDRIKEFSDIVDTYKFDRSQMEAAYLGDATSLEIAKGIVRAGKKIRDDTRKPFYVIAEGAPPGSEKMLKEIGVTHVQSYELSSYPLSKEELFLKIKEDFEGSKDKFVYF